MSNERLGVVRAAVIVFASGLVVGALMTLFAPFAWQWMSTGSRGGAEPDWGAVVVSMALVFVLQAVGVAIGVRMYGFRVGVVFTTFALGLTAAITLGILYMTAGSLSGDPTGVAAPALGVMWIPLVLAIEIVLPAVFINDAARPALDHLPPELSYDPYFRYPPDLPPPQPRR